MLWMPIVDPSAFPNFACVIFKIIDVASSTVFLVHNGSDNTISILGGYVYNNKNHVECDLRVVARVV